MRTSPAAPLLLTTLSAFQASLAAGAPWGRAAFGGQHPGRLPVPLRVTSAVATIVYAAGAGALVSSRTSPGARRTALRGCLALGVLGTVMNAVSRSPVERMWSVWSLGLVVSAWRELRRRR
ncbi:hypothetical protein [Arthrobacter sp.]|uniref:hypothetical protein n=1 Tax=Arthrobacter sp. TaxID=1667 RepID=UPI00289D10BE|nr:hypothetical protein [Arthrobacter sp.]